jgi:hypothetical protein
MPPNTEPVGRRHLRFGCTARPTTAVPEPLDGDEEKQQEAEEGEEEEQQAVGGEEEEGEPPWFFQSGELDNVIAEELDIALVAALEGAPTGGAGVEEEKGGEAREPS